MGTMTGTMAFMAPEVMGGWVYDERVDIWSIGVVTFIMLTKHMPEAKTQCGGTFACAKAAKTWALDSHYFSKLPAAARSFIGWCREKEEHRPTAVTLLTHMWLHEVNRGRGLTK